ncbi:hypothetical protein AJ87_04550 [Rhizobium yanglingense]|nr:hypothetical protein AJ87_04550 [Rhizobium yanglingense]
MVLVAARLFPPFDDGFLKIVRHEQHSLHAERLWNRKVARQVLEHGRLAGFDSFQCHELVIGNLRRLRHEFGGDDVEDVVEMFENAECTGRHFGMFDAAVGEDELAARKCLDRRTQFGLSREARIVDGMGLFQKVVRVTP